MQNDFLSCGRRIPVDVYHPRDTRQHPAVIVLHGSGGVARYGQRDRYAELLAGQGFAVFLPHYFEATGTTWADEATIWREFPTWMQVIADCITFAAQHPHADPQRIALVGFSLGGYLALAVAAEHPDVKAVVEFFGGLPPPLIGTLQRMPPILILHGDADRTVPVSEAYTIARVLDEKKLPYEMQIYRGAGHGFGPLEMLDAGARTLTFLRKHLRAAEAA